MMEDPNPASFPHHAGVLDDPFRVWPNSDLLINDDDRAFFTRHYPVFAPIFDWPELRSLFIAYDAVAARARKHSRRAGVIAVVIGFFSLSVGAIVPLADEFTKGDNMAPFRTVALLGGIAGILAIVSILLGYTQVLKGKEKDLWLKNRFCTERIRQFHFQLIVNNLSPLVEAIKRKDALQDWLSYRARELDQFKYDYLLGLEDKILQLYTDDAEDRPWISEEWDRAGSVPPASPEFDALLMLLQRQRFGIQQRYAERKLLNGWHSPETRSIWVREFSDVLTASVLLATIAAGIGSITALLFGTGPRVRSIAMLVAAISSAGVVAMRALREGLLFGADAERYKWYIAAVRTLYRRFDYADTQLKVNLLRELEHVAYQEMRRFMLSASRARFVM